MALLSKHLVVFLLLAITASYGQINGYAKVTNIAGNILTVTNVNETFDSFEDGEKVILIQMQDASIAGNTANSISFGQISSIQTTGNYEVFTVNSHTESDDIPTTLTLSGAPTKLYNPSASLQLVSFPTLGNPHYTTTSNISALQWNGTTGGIIAFNVNGNLILKHDIEANGRGFRGGSVAGNNASGCISSTFITAADPMHGNKGEGIFHGVYGNSANPYVAGRAPLTNGGGGASVHNAGGAGGSNITNGGDGGLGYACSAAAGGIGGLNLNTYSTAGRAFMGGGGGGGQGNNSVGSDGANGGGIIFITADSIISGACGKKISTDGANSANAGNDGAGGAGAGGTVVLQIKGMHVNSACSLFVSSNGGNGGNINHDLSHGAGGGGGQGAIYASITLPVTNATFTTTNGLGGLNNNTSTATRAGSGAGANNTGIRTGMGSPLPVELKSFMAVAAGNKYHINWSVSGDKNVRSYELLRSFDGVHWVVLGKRNPSRASSLIQYHSFDYAEGSTRYYQLRITDEDNVVSYSHIISVSGNIEVSHFSMFPNPSNDKLTIHCDEIISRVVIVSHTGQEVVAFNKSEDLDISDLTSGYYSVLVYSESGIRSGRLVKK